MKLLLIGQFPPPHGGISVHIAEMQAQLTRIGVCCHVLNVDKRAPTSDQYIRIRNGLDLVLELLRHARRGWMLHFHTSGHNIKSWILALVCGLAGLSGPGRVLTLHSGMVPDYLRGASAWQRCLARFACSLYSCVVCVNPEIAQAVSRRLGISSLRLKIIPAFLPSMEREVTLPEPLEQRIGKCKPLFSTALFFRPEYGFELLVKALVRLRSDYQRLGCLVLGGDQQEVEAQNFVRTEGMEDSIFLVGDVSHNLCLALIARSNIFVRPTLKDGDAICVREALSLGVPVVASNVGTRPQGALLFEPGSVDDLVSKIKTALAQPRPAFRREPEDKPDWSGLEKVLQTYQRIIFRNSQRALAGP
jgi:glycosyltransferase involved in cell wall biosynthesis